MCCVKRNIVKKKNEAEAIGVGVIRFTLQCVYFTSYFFLFLNTDAVIGYGWVSEYILGDGYRSGALWLTGAHGTIGMFSRPCFDSHVIHRRRRLSTVGPPTLFHYILSIFSVIEVDMVTNLE